MDQPEPSRPPHSHTTFPKLNSTDRTSTHPHHLHRRIHGHHGRTRTRDAIHSAVQLQSPFSFESYNPLKRAHIPGTGDSSRRGSTGGKDRDNSKEASPLNNTQKHTPQGSADSSGTAAATFLIRAPEPATRRDVERERALRPTREGEIASVFSKLDQDAHGVTRRLDDLYYSLLEKWSQLRSSLVALEELHDSIVKSRTEFGEETDKLEKRVDDNLSKFKSFDTQEKTIEELVDRLDKGRKKAKALEERLDKVRQRLGTWEEVEKESRKISHRRWGIFWTALVLLVAVMLLVLVWRTVRGKEDDIAGLARSAAGYERTKVRDGGRANRSVVGINLSGDAKAEARRDEEWQHVLDEF